MSKQILLHMFLLYSIHATLGSKSYIEDYCWRDYDGIIPSDAMAHGLDGNGKPIYLGQVLFENKIVPGQIYDDDKNIYFEWNDKEISTFKNVKILCSKNANKFEWIPTTSNDVVLLTNKILIKGGYEAGYSTYIGRKEENGITFIGKVICSTDDCFGLFSSHAGKTFLYATFQILTYNP